MRVLKFLETLDIDMNEWRHTCLPRGSNARSLKRNHYITSK